MRVAWKTDTGRVRDHNEDKVMIDQDRGIFLLADGMGGHNAGEVASELAVKSAYSFILREMADSGVNECKVPDILKGALFSAHNTVKAKAESDSEMQGMGTTLVELIIKDNNAYLCHAGDSRGYLFRDQLQRLTKDHTVGDAYVECGSMETERVPERLWHVLTQAVGVGGRPGPEMKTIELQEGDILLLCSDGLTDMLSDDEIQTVAEGHREELDELVERLVQQANNKGGRDNISVVAVGI